ncbi:hypothetical protein CC77DRAFT_369763 [Alternaria alternata]|uniref:Uncharacterized protein n=1 Tax=Alternaria alternata TaxID=5599 RepID=A0A177DBY6_ALTAL|nr:hypothetical protein CC77DRAFT_369763 [Alternaria alternata]OAG16986.1 hypothetical protein CC77DRAFT_369763 [Alternaria alternata]
MLMGLSQVLGCIGVCNLQLVVAALRKSRCRYATQGLWGHDALAYTPLCIQSS